MVKLLEKAIAKLATLPEEQQETMAKWILDELEDEARWDAAFASSLPQLEQLADKALKDFESGNTDVLEPDELT